MRLDNVLVADIETIGLLPKLKTFKDLHVMSCSYKDKQGIWRVISTNKFEDIQKMFGNPDNTIVMHNGICFDKPALELMGIEVKAEIIDTLALSYYLYSERDKHGLEVWGAFFGVPKPEIEDWEGLTYEEYKHRCEEDVKINTNLWVMMLSYLRNLYDNDDELIIKTIRYLNFKMTKLRSQEENPIQIDMEQCRKNLEFLEGVIAEKEAELNAIMPKVPVKAKRTKPKVCFKKDGSLSVAGEKWFLMVNQLNLPSDYEGVIEEITKYEEPNCQSANQMKDFLFSLGWKPTIFKDGANGKVPQLRDDDKNLCPDIQRLIEENPSLQALDGLSVAQHRSGYLKGFLAKADENGRASAWASAFTRTLRLKHAAPFANLPKPSSPHGALVRGVMVAPEGYVCIGADLSSIEDKCKQISIYDLDPEYVKSMNTKGWDAHLALGEKAGMFTADEVQFYKWYKNKKKDDNPYTCPEAYINMSEEEQEHFNHKLDKVRATAKTTNYACTYGAGAAKIAETTDMTLKEAKKLHAGYHEINWSVKKFAETRKVKTVMGTNWRKLHKKAGGLQETTTSDWIWNEYSKMWLFLKNDKDRFSACNQNFGVKVFDMWAYFLMQEGINFSAEFHDEEFWYCKDEPAEIERHIQAIKNSIVKVNKYFNPPIPIECDYKIGKNYAEVH